MTPRKALHFYSYDCARNPWLGGGGAYRDMEILRRMGGHFESVRLHVGAYPGAQRRNEHGIEIVPLGFGKSEIVSRITYVLCANWRILFHRRKRMLGISLSPYSPFLTALVHRKRLYAILHHSIGRNWTCKVGKAVGWILWKLEFLYYRLPRNFVAVNDAVAEEILARTPRARVHRSANGFDLSLLLLEDASTDSLPFILFVGRLDPFMKGLDLLVEAFAAIAPRYPDLKLVMAGRGDPESEKCIAYMAREHGLEDRIVLRTNVSGEEKARLLSECLLFCSPSRFEGFGIAALEANAAGKAVVASQACGFKNSICDGYSGTLVDVLRGGNLAGALIDLLDHPEKRERMGRQGREWVLQFTWDAIAEKEARWMSACLESAGANPERNARPAWPAYSTVRADGAGSRRADGRGGLPATPSPKKRPAG